MANYTIVNLHDLPEVPATADTAVFAQSIENGKPKSGKVFLNKIIDFVHQVAALLQIERRLSFRLENLYPEMLIDEGMTIYKVGVLNVQSLIINIEKVPENSAGNWEPKGGTDFAVDITPGAILSLHVPARSLITIKAEPISTDTKKWYVFIYAKANQQ